MKPLARRFTSLLAYLVAILVTIWPSTGGADIINGLVHHWTFDESSGVVAGDSAGSNDATLFNWGPTELSWSPGIIGGALSFGDDNNSARTAAPIDLDEYTFAFWLKSNGAESQNFRIATPQGAAQPTWVAFNSDGSSGVGIAPVNDPRNITLGAWDHFAIVFDRANSQASVYRNGQLADAGAVSRALPGSNWLFGHHQDLGNNAGFFAGQLDDFRIYDRLLTDGDVTELATLPPTPGLEAHLVAPFTNFGSQPQGEYDTQSTSLNIDPSQTEWIAWNRYPELRGSPSAQSSELLLGTRRPEIDDFVRLTITNPLNDTLTVDLDQNGALGDPIGQQAMIFGAAVDAPDVLRGNNTGSPSVFDEAGAFNSIFTVPGNYQFDFSFRNIGGPASYPEVYLLVQSSQSASAIPEPSTVVLGIVGAAVLVMLRWRQSRKSRP